MPVDPRSRDAVLLPSSGGAHSAGRRARVTVVGQLARDLALQVDEIPGPRSSADARQRIEALGGKGANQARAVAQLGADAALVAAVGDDAVGHWLLEQARVHGIDVAAVAVRPGAPSALIASVVERNAAWRYITDIPSAMLLSAEDVEAAAPTVAGSDMVIVQLEQPKAAALAAIGIARRAGATVAADGAPRDGEERRAVLKGVDILRADDREAQVLAGRSLDGASDALKAARDLLADGPRLVVLSAGEHGNVFAWEGGELVLPLDEAHPVDTTGAGDAFIAALAVGLAQGAGVRRSARAASRAAAQTVAHLSGQPRLGSELAMFLSPAESAAEDPDLCRR